MTHGTRRATAISPLVSLRQAGNDLDEDPRYVKGYAECMGIRLIPSARSLFMTDEDFGRLERRLKQHKGRAHRPRSRQPEPAGA